MWVSGFYGSGKSHLVKVLRYLWEDYGFPDGATARGLVDFSGASDIKTELQELTVKGNRFGKPFAAAGKMRSSRTPRLNVLSTVLQALNLPTDYAAARLVFWLKDEQVYDQVCASLVAQGTELGKQLPHMYVSEHLAKSILLALPALATSEANLLEQIKATFRSPADGQDIDDDSLIDVLNQALQKDGELPYTLLVLDELQQYIHDDPEIAYAIQLIAEALSKRFKGRLLLVGTGQFALSSTPLLQKIQDRFTVQVQLSDRDVADVTRDLILRKKPDQASHVAETLEKVSGEIDRHLSTSRLYVDKGSIDSRVSDYPILPIRRRFWEELLRQLDPKHSAGQLRSQIQIVHYVVNEYSNEDLGVVVPADMIFDQLSGGLQGSAELSKDDYNFIRKQHDGTKHGGLKYRATALIYLISKLPADLKVKANVDTLADLLVEDLRAGSAVLRDSLRSALDDMEAKGELLRIDDEYRLQTPEGSKWETAFRKALKEYETDDQLIAEERTKLLREHLGTTLKDLKKRTQGVSKTPRTIELCYQSGKPVNSTGSVKIWVSDGWDTKDEAVRTEAQLEGPEGPMVFVFIPRHKPDEFKKAIANWRAAFRVLETESGEVSTPRQAMETRQNKALEELQQLLIEAMEQVKVYQGGGNDIEGELKSAIDQSISDSLVRLFPDFDLADSPYWPHVKEAVKKGAGDALSKVNYQGEVANHPVCKRILGFLTKKLKGKDIREHFTAPPYGWPQDAIDAALLVLLKSNHVTANLDGKAVTAQLLDQTKIGVCEFNAATIVLNVDQRLELKKLLQAFDVQFKPQEEIEKLPLLISKLVTIAQCAGGEPPAPAIPQAPYLMELSALSDIDLAQAVFENKDRIAADKATWEAHANAIAQRMPKWKQLVALKQQADASDMALTIESDYMAVSSQRQLLAEPDPVAPLLKQVAETLRGELNALYEAYQKLFQAGMTELKGHEVWQQLKPEQQISIFNACNLALIPKPSIGTEEELLKALQAHSLPFWITTTEALGTKFSKALKDATALIMPAAIQFKARGATLRTAEEVEAYVNEMRAQLMAHIKEGKHVVVQS